MITEELYNRYFSHLLSGNRAECRNIVRELLERNIDVKELYTVLFQPAMYRVGELWECNKISVATEHLATSITEYLLTLVYPILFSSAHIGEKAIISCSVNEFHQVGGKMVADIFELHGWDGYFLGANTPADDLIQLIHEKKPGMVGLSLSVYFNMAPLLSMIEKIKVTFPDLNMIVGGQAFRWGGADLIQKFPYVTYVASLDDLEKMIARD